MTGDTAWGYKDSSGPRRVLDKWWESAVPAMVAILPDHILQALYDVEIPPMM